MEQGNQLLITFSMSDEKSFFSFAYRGINNSDMSEDEIKSKISFVFEREKSINNISRIISIIRAILIDVDEKMLDISYGNSNNELIKAVYIDKKIYECTIKQTRVDQKQGEFSLKYNKNGINISLNNLYSDIVDSTHINEIPNLLYDEMELLNDLINTKNITIYRDERLLCEMYRRFYKKDIDFTSEHITEELQSMIGILYSLDIINKRRYGCINVKGGNTESSVVSEIVNKLIPLGKIDKFSDEELDLSDEDIKYLYKIEIIGNEILNEINRYENKYDRLKELTRVLFYSMYSITKDDHIKRISKLANSDEFNTHKYLNIGEKIKLLTK